MIDQFGAYLCEQCEHWHFPRCDGNGNDRYLTCEEEEVSRKKLSDYAALAYLRWLEAKHPGVHWVRVRDGERTA